MSIFRHMMMMIMMMMMSCCPSRCCWVLADHCWQLLDFPSAQHAGAPCEKSAHETVELLRYKTLDFIVISIFYLP